MSNYLEYKGYIGTVEFHAEDEVFFGKIHGINDLVSFEASSVKELKKVFVESVDDYLETCKQLKKQPNKTYKGTFNVRLTSELHQKAAFIAYKKNLTLNDFVKKAITHAIAHQDHIDKDIIQA